MNYTTLIQVTIIISLVLGGTYLFFYTKQQKWLKDHDLKDLNLCFDLSYSLAKQIGLDKQPYAKEMLQIINETLKYFIGIENATVEEVQGKSLTLVLALCKRRNIEVNDERKEMLKTLINIGVKEIVLK